MEERRKEARKEVLMDMDERTKGWMVEEIRGWRKEWMDGKSCSRVLSAAKPQNRRLIRYGKI